jgi:hypothetical protein
MLSPEHTLDLQANEEVEEEIAMGCQRLPQRRGVNTADYNKRAGLLYLACSFRPCVAQAGWRQARCSPLPLGS